MADVPKLTAPQTDMIVRNLVVTGTFAAANSSGSAGNPQRFFYVATGLEGDSFPVALPAARASTSYMAKASNAGVTNPLVFDCPQAGYLIDRFTLVCSAPPVAGDKIAITVEDLT